MPELNFNNHNTLYATHGLHAYAAKCPPQLVRYGLRYYSKPGDRILDPMVGGGTTLVEARLMGRNAIGYEIDPLARLIAQVKSRELDDEHIECAYENVSRRATRDWAMLNSGKVPLTVRARATPPDFPNRDYWFDPQVSAALALLAYHIGDCPTTKGVRDFLWVAFSSLILAKTSVANARDIIHSRHHYWQHSQTPKVLEKFDARVQRMRKQMADFRTRCQSIARKTSAEARLGDARCLRVHDESIDLVFTSPPYATALDYPRAHFLAIPWMHSALGVDLDQYRANAPKYIGSMQGKLGNDFALEPQIADFELAASILTQLAKSSERQAKLAQRYFSGMYVVLGHIARVLKDHRHAVLVVCPSHIRRIDVPTHEIFGEMGLQHGLYLKKRHVRIISERRRVMPYMNAFGSRMSTEYVLVFQKY